MIKLKDKILNLINNIDGDVSVYIKDINNKECIKINEQEKFHAASIIKIPILWEGLRQAQVGEKKLNHKIILSDSEKVGGAGILQLLHNGLQLTLEDMLHLMIDISDNTATNILIDYLGKEKINKTLNDLGMNNTIVARKLMKVVPGLYSYTTTEDIGKMLECLELREGLNNEYAQKGIDILLKQQFNDCISGNLLLCCNCNYLVLHKNICPNCNSNISDVDADYVKFAHKTGEIVGVVHDAGIMYINDKPIVITVLTKGLKNNKTGYKLLKDIGLEIYNYYSNILDHHQY